jgi:hypothetical protein
MKIKFIPKTDFIKEVIPPPTPAKKSLPEWFKHIPMYINGDKNLKVINNGPNTTVKACSPFLESLIFGYVIELAADIEVIHHKEDQRLEIKSATEGLSLVSAHDNQQVLNMTVSNEYFRSTLKWENFYIIETPPGYSTMFMHPLNRQDLPFTVFSGVVETDTYNLPVNFPFLLKKFEGESIIIPKGTPICQFFPIKREDWDSSVKEPINERYNINLFKLKSIIDKSYKKLFWKKKNFN